MASIDTGSGGRSPNIELNLVPFIDLMSVMITFLLITAVWTQINMIQIGSSLYSKNNIEQEVVKTPDQDVILRLDVLPSGYRLVAETSMINIPKLGADEYDNSQLLARIEQFKLKYPKKIDAVITMADDLPYKRLIDGMDLLMRGGFPTVSVATGGAY